MRALPFLLLLTACTELQQFVPTVDFQRLDVSDIDFEHIETDFVFAVHNPNPVEVGLSSFSWDLDLEGVDLVSGDQPDGFGLAAAGDSELRLPVDLSWADAWSTVQATRGEDIVDFALSGHFGFDTPIGEARIPYAEDGDFPALRTPKFAFDKLRVTHLDLFSQEADLALDLKVDNDHGSTLFFDGMDYQIALDGVSVADGSLSHLGEVAGASQDILTVPLTVDLLAAGVTVADAIIQKKPLPVRLDAVVDVDTPWGIVPLDVSEIGDAILQ